MAATINITIDQGSDFEYTFALTNTQQMNLVNAHAFAAMKTEWDVANSVPFSASMAGANLTITMAGSVTANLHPGIWVYDAIVIDSTNVVTRAVQGRVTVSPQVTLHP